MKRVSFVFYISIKRALFKELKMYNVKTYSATNLNNPTTTDIYTYFDWKSYLEQWNSGKFDSVPFDMFTDVSQP